MKYFNQRFNQILNRFLEDTKPHNSITIDYYTSALPTRIVQLVNEIAKPTLIKNYEEDITVEKELHAIGVISYYEPKKHYKDIGKRSQASVSKANEKETCDLENLTHMLKNMSNEMGDLKQISSETAMSRNPPRLNLVIRIENSGSSSDQSTKSVQSSNVILNYEGFFMDTYYSYHQSFHSKKEFPQWNHTMNVISWHICDVVLVDEQSEPEEEKKENVETDKTPSVGCTKNMYNCVLIA